MIGVLIFIIIIIAVLLSIHLNPDLVSPVKFYYLYLIIYFAGIFYNEYLWQVYIIYLSLIIIGVILSIIESKYSFKLNYTSNFDSNINNKKTIKTVFILIWIISIVPLFSQLYLIAFIGGIENYINSIGIRVVVWQGKGLYFQIIKLFGLLNIIYFSFIILNKKTTYKQISFFLIHLLVFVLIGLLSGSRGGLLNNFIYMIIIYSFMKFRVSIRTLIFSGGILLLLALIIGVARDGYEINDNGFQTGFEVEDKSIWDKLPDEHGIRPIQLVLNSIQIQELEKGKTYFTVITNLVPRKFWPEKPSSGGVILTEKYANNAWGGYSYISTGMIAEGMLNFGIFFGTVFGLLLMFFLVFFLVVFYGKLKVKLNSRKSLFSIFTIIAYVHVLTGIPNLLFGEWTNIILGIIWKVLAVYGFYFTIKWILFRGE